MKALVASALVALSLAAPAAAQDAIGTVAATGQSNTSIFHFDLSRDPETNLGTLRPGLGNGTPPATRAPASMRAMLSAIARHNAGTSAGERIVVRDSFFGRQASTAGGAGLSRDARRAIAIQNATAANSSERIYISN